MYSDIDRESARMKLLNLLPPDIVLKVETSILEFTLITMTFKKFNINIFSNIYNDKLNDIYNNLDPNNKYIQNKTLLYAVVNNFIDPNYIAFMSPQQLNPETWKRLLDKAHI